jgi:heme oxygenase
LTLGEYICLVERFFGFYAPWEEALQPFFPRWLPDYDEERKKTPKLAKDLQFFGLPIGDVRLCESLPVCAGFADLLGGLYVAEGATLGGQLIARHLERSLGLSGGNGYTFFSSYGPSVGRKWTEFRDLLRRKAEPAMEDQIVVSARQVFQALHGWLCCSDQYGCRV